MGVASAQAGGQGGRVEGHGGDVRHSVHQADAGLLRRQLRPLGPSGGRGRPGRRESHADQQLRLAPAARRAREDGRGEPRSDGNLDEQGVQRMSQGQAVRPRWTAAGWGVGFSWPGVCPGPPRSHPCGHRGPFPVGGSGQPHREAHRYARASAGPG
ncbi:hypothetical protein GCM10009731_24070 [Streptomyces globosus]